MSFLNHGSGRCGGKYEVQYVELHITVFWSPQRHAVPSPGNLRGCLFFLCSFLSVRQLDRTEHTHFSHIRSCTEFNKIHFDPVESAPCPPPAAPFADESDDQSNLLPLTSIILVRFSRPRHFPNHLDPLSPYSTFIGTGCGRITPTLYRGF